MSVAVLLDIDGVLTVSWEALPGAVDTVKWLSDENIQFRLVTNTSSKSRHQIAKLLEQAGMPVGEDRILTAVTSASHELKSYFPGVACLVVNEGDITEDLGEIPYGDGSTAGVALLGGAGPSVSYDDLNQVFRMALEGKSVIALHRNTRFQTRDGQSLDMGTFIIGLEAAAKINIPIMGKPAKSFFSAALANIGSSEKNTIMVGDDIASDVIGAQEFGLTGILVKTGKFRESDLSGEDRSPDHVIDDIGKLQDLLAKIL